MDTDLMDFEHLVPIAERRDEKGRRIITVESRDATVPRCCLLQELRKNGRKTVKCRDYPLQRRPVLLEVKRQRYECKACGAVVYEVIPELDPDRQVTERFRNQICWDAVDHTFTDAAKMNGVERPSSAGSSEPSPRNAWTAIPWCCRASWAWMRTSCWARPTSSSATSMPQQGLA